MKNPEHDYQCRAPYCKNVYDLIYLGLKVCQACYKDYCKEGDPDLRKQVENTSDEELYS